MGEHKDYEDPPPPPPHHPLHASPCHRCGNLFLPGLCFSNAKRSPPLFTLKVSPLQQIKVAFLITAAQQRNHGELFRRRLTNGRLRRRGWAKLDVRAERIHRDAIGPSTKSQFVLLFFRSLSATQNSYSGLLSADCCAWWDR